MSASQKTFMGQRLRLLRQERGLTQAALARLVAVSPSYLNQIERDQRPLTAAVRSRLNAALGLAIAAGDGADEARLAVDLRAALADHGVSLADVRALAAQSPDLARAVIAMGKRLQAATERADALAGHLTEGPSGTFEAVRDWFYEHRNHVPELDLAAEAISGALPPGAVAPALIARLAQRHGLAVSHDAPDQRLRVLEPGRLRLAPHLGPGQQAFQMATQLAFLEQGPVIDRLSDAAGLAPEARALLRVGLANYYAGALILPYRAFLATAEETAYDIELIAERFGVGFETACHRLSTLQRDGARGVPFFFIRVDRAGNISKRQSATDFHFSRMGGSCPLWNVYAAFARPGEILRQVAQMPDGRSYLWIARMVRRRQGGFRGPDKTFAVALGCDLTHAGRLVYGRGLDLKNPDLAVRIGPGCKVCERRACPQRAFPMAGRPLAVDPDRASFPPYGGG